MGADCPWSVFNTIAKVVLGLSTNESLIAQSFDKCTVAEAPAAEAGRIKPMTKTIASRADKSIFLFFIDTSLSFASY
jgi:hypothetical protein